MDVLLKEAGTQGLGSKVHLGLFRSSLGQLKPSKGEPRGLDYGGGYRNPKHEALKPETAKAAQRPKPTLSRRPPK